MEIASGTDHDVVPRVVGAVGQVAVWSVQVASI